MDRGLRPRQFRFAGIYQCNLSLTEYPTEPLWVEEQLGFGAALSV